MELQLFAIFLLFSLFPQYYAYATHFFHLAGYKILADPLNGPEFFENSTLCAAECAFGYDRICVGYRYINGECQLYMNIRNIIMHSKSCGYRVIDRTDEQKENPIMATLNKTDQLVYAVLYEGSTCPDGFTVNITSCSVPMLESECNEYSKFVNATFDGTECAIPANRSQWYCAPQNNPHQKMLFVNADIGYCYFKINATVPPSVAAFNQQCKSASSASSFVTICSSAENDFIASISTQWPTYLSLYTPAAPSTKGVYNWSDSSSNVGRYCNYRNWQLKNAQTSDDEPNDYAINTEVIAAMSDNRYWYDVSEASIITADETLICKEKAFTLEEYISQCQSLDNCEQLNLSKAKDEL